MASTPPTNEAFLREVDEELRKDQLVGFWKRWGRWLVVALVAALAGFAAYMWWQARQERAREAQGEAFTQVLNDLEASRRVGVEAKLAPLAEGDTPGYRATAKLTLAALKLQENDVGGAAAAFKAVADDASLPQPFRDLATIRWTATEYDMLTPQQVIARLERLAVKGNPWFGSAGEMTAIAHMSMNQPKRAGPIFAAIAADEAVPESIRQRAVQMAGVLGVDAVSEPAGVER